MSLVSLILSAGESSRMGRMASPKALLSWNGKSLLAHAVDSARDAGVSAVVVVTGAHHLEMQSELARLNVQPILNPRWKSGMGSSIKAGVSVIEKTIPDVSAILIQLVDQPKVGATCIRKLLELHRLQSSSIVCAQYDGQPGVPVIFPKPLFATIFSIEDQEGAKKILLQNLEHLRRVEMLEALEDVDTPEQFARL
jgi:molybdenum cofactor cytidylyltransferase